MAYQGTVRRIKAYPIGERKLKSIKPEHLQQFFDHLSFGGKNPDGTTQQPISRGYMRLFTAVMQNAFRFAVFPKRLIGFNPMQYVLLRGQKDEVDLFSGNEEDAITVPTLSHETYKELMSYLQKKKNPAILPIQIAYYTGLRIGEVCGLTWQDIDLEDQYLTVRRSVRYNYERKKHEVGTTKRKKVRTVDFCDTLAVILKEAKMEQMKNRMKYGVLYRRNYYREVSEKDRIYYELYTLSGEDDIPDDYKEIDFVCLRDDGAIELPNTVALVCRTAKKKIPGLEDFHFHMLRHTYTSNMLSGGAAPKDVQEFLGHSDVSTTMNIYAHSSREAKRNSAKLLDKAVGADA